MRARFTGIVVLLVLCAITRGDCPPGDFNRDCRVDAADLLLFANDWLTGLNSAADLAGDADVDARDLAAFARHWQQVDCPIVINEVLAHAHAEASDWIEFYNVSTVPVDIGGWFLSDTYGDLERYQIPEGTVVEPNGYVVLYETTHFGNPFDPGARVLFAFTENGEGAYLYSGDDEVFPNYLASQTFGASETSYSFGRYLKSTGTYDFPTMSVTTPGKSNAYPRVGPVVIDEIMYHPVDSDAEYLELLNVSETSVTLFDYECGLPWRLTDNSGIDFSFPADAPVTLAPGEHVLVARDLPTAQTRYEIPSGTQMFSWDSGKLANQGETLQLFKPGDVDDRGVRYWIEVDRVTYSDGSHGEGFAHEIDPWPVEADGEGLSLNRLFPSRYGNDPNNWDATIATPGAAND